MNQVEGVCLFSRIVQYQRVWYEPVAGSRLAATHVLPSRNLFWNRSNGEVSCDVMFHYLVPLTALRLMCSNISLSDTVSRLCWWKQQPEIQ